MPRGSNFRRPYPPEFRRAAVELYRRGGQPLDEVARDLGVATESLRTWAKQAGIDAGLRDGLTSGEREELRRLRREKRAGDIRKTRLLQARCSASFPRTTRTRRVFTRRSLPC
jgi:transposase